MWLKENGKKIFDYLSNLRYFSTFLSVVGLYISYILMFKFSEYALLFKVPVLFADWFPSQPEYEFFAMKLWFISLVIWIVLFVFIRKEKEKVKKLKLWLLSVLLALVFYFSFYVTNISYVYKNHSCLLMYKSFDCETISNKERYFKYLKKYGFSINWYAKFETLEDSIEAMEFAKEYANEKNKIRAIYRGTFRDLDRFWYDKILEAYNDKTFQVYFVSQVVSININEENDRNFFLKNFYLLEKIAEYSDDQLLKDTVTKLLSEYQKLWNLSEEEGMELIRTVYTNFSKKIWDIDGVAEQVF